MKFKNLAIAMGFAGSILLVGQAQAGIIIDNWNILASSSTSANDNTASNGGVSTPRTGINQNAGNTPDPAGGLEPNAFGFNWGTRGDVYADLFSGDGVQTQDCGNCDQGHGVNDANSIGNGYWSWTGSATNMNGAVSLFYDADIANGDLVLSFVGGGSILDQIWWSDLAAGAQTLAGSVSALGVDEIYLDWFSVGGIYDAATHGAGNYGSVVTARNFGLAATSLDLNVDNLTVPEPGSMALLGLGLVGLGWQRRRRNDDA